MKIEKIAAILAFPILLSIFFLVGTIYPSWSGLTTLSLIWLIGLGIIALGIFVAEKFGRKWAPILIIGILSGFTILADLGSIKLSLIKLSGYELIAPAGSLLFAVLYFGEDYLNELYGRRLARINVYAGWLAKISVALGMLFIIFVMQSPNVPSIIETNRQFDSLLLLGPRLNISSIVAILVAGLINVEVFSTLKKKLKGKHLWFRSAISSTTAIIVDNIVFTFGAFSFVLPFSKIWNMAWTTSFIHITIALWGLPFLYTLRWLKHKNIIGQKEELIIKPRGIQNVTTTN